jgi:hypothetical protein
MVNIVVLEKKNILLTKINLIFIDQSTFRSIKIMADQF